MNNIIIDDVSNINRYAQNDRNITKHISGKKDPNTKTAKSSNMSVKVKSKPKRKLKRKSNYKDTRISCNNKQNVGSKNKSKIDQSKRKTHSQRRLRQSKPIIVNGEKMYQCTDMKCKKTYANQRTVCNHFVAKHTTRFQCKTCKICFSGYSSLKKHAKRHEQESKYQCQYCDKRFESSCAWTAHTRTHTGERSYQCQICAKKYTTKDKCTNCRHQSIF